MPIVRLKKHSHPFVMIDKRALHDARLSWKAKGLVAYLLCKPNHWKVRLAELVKRAPDGSDSVRAGLNELRRYGYSKFGPMRNPEGRLMGTEWTIYEHPTLAATDVPVFPMSVNPDVREAPTSGKSQPTNNECTRKQQQRTNIRNKAPLSYTEEEDFLKQVRELCGVEEMRNNGGSWRLRARCNPRALKNAIDDLKVRQDNYHHPIRRPAAWLNRQFTRNLAELEKSRNAAHEIPFKPAELRTRIRQSLQSV